MDNIEYGFGDDLFEDDDIFDEEWEDQLFDERDE